MTSSAVGDRTRRQSEPSEKPGVTRKEKPKNNNKSMNGVVGQFSGSVKPEIPDKSSNDAEEAAGEERTEDEEMRLEAQRAYLKPVKDVSTGPAPFLGHKNYGFELTKFQEEEQKYEEGQILRDDDAEDDADNVIVAV